MTLERYCADDEAMDLMKETAKSILTRARIELNLDILLKEIVRYYINFKFKRFNKEIIGYELCYEIIELCYFFLGRHWSWHYRSIPLCRVSCTSDGDIKVESLDQLFDQIFTKEESDR